MGSHTPTSPPNAEWARLSAEHQPGAFEHEKSAMGLEVEQARLVAYGSLGALAVAWTCAFQTERTVCFAYLEWASALLAAAGAFGWNALGFSAAAHSSRSRFETAQMLALYAISQGKEGTENSVDARDALTETHRARNISRMLSTTSSVMAGLSFPLLYKAAQQTLTGSCSKSLAIDMMNLASGLWPF